LNTLQDKTVIVTGASAGVGRAIALRFAAEGAHVGLIARDSSALADVKYEIEELGGKAVVAAADVADAQAVASAADMIEEQLGPVDIWVNDAMVTVFSPIWDITPEEYRRVTEVTYLGCVHGTMAALRTMRPRNQGTIIQIGSALAFRGIPLQSAYCGAKHAIRGFTDSVRSELIHTGKTIDLTIMELPAVNTPQFDWARTHMARKPRPVPPVVEPEVIADAVVHAAYAPRREYWIGWSTLKVIFGNMLFPGMLDRYLARAAYGAQESQSRVSDQRKDNLIEPVSALHRTRGRFGKESADTAFVAVGPEARIAAVAIGAAAFLALGLVAGRHMTRDRRW
jgi:NADP-dependent 3-hydroxy acid dehydrogenase YdfG